jgi:hypothetical protein
MVTKIMNKAGRIYRGPNKPEMIAAFMAFNAPPRYSDMLREKCGDERAEAIMRRILANRASAALERYSMFKTDPLIVQELIRCEQKEKGDGRHKNI